MKDFRKYCIVILAAAFLGCLIPACEQADMVTGRVVDENGPVPGAVVRVKTSDNHTLTDELGDFILPGVSLPVTITAWADGYFVGWSYTDNETDNLTITLKPYYTSDNHDYDWFSLEGADGSQSCGHCMPSFPEWAEDAHAQSAVNPRFLTMYNGTDVQGNQSPLTRYIHVKDYGILPLAPDPNRPYYGPGYKLDFPDTAGNCSACHVPAMAAHPGMAYGADPNDAEGIELEGVFCEFCHKIGDVTIDEETGMPYPNMPGVLSMRLFRPDEGQQLFFGNFDDVTRRVSYLPLIEESAFCAPCHYGTFWDVEIYNSFGEWLDSPYSDPLTGQTCQDCHMPAVDYNYFVYPEKGGHYRNPERISSHLMPGAADEAFLRDAVTMDLAARLDNASVQVDVTITNDNTGHHVPTDSPLRHMILLVEAVDGDNESLLQTGGPTVPEWAGIGEPADGYYAGLPGKAFAKILEESWTGISPTGSYWNLTHIVSDNRLAAFEADTSSYGFTAAGPDFITVKATLVFRRAFIELVDQKGWELQDIVMSQQQVTLQQN